LAILPELLGGINHFVDVGASLGQYTFHANRLLEGGRIDAIEPDPVRFQKLSQNCLEWGADGKNHIHPHHLAISQITGETVFFTTCSNVSGGLFPHSLDHLDAQISAEVKWREIKVPSVSLDDFCAGSAPDFVKMDIEGAEYDALQGAQQLLEQRRTTWLIELHEWGAGQS
jgi:FkbM family methyltransferase